MAKTYRVFRGETFYDIAAETEEEAQEKACQLLRSKLQADDFTAWEISDMEEETYG